MTVLPDISRLGALSSAEWMGVGKSLRELGLTGPLARELGSTGARLVAGTYTSLRRWHLRRSDEPVAHGLRMLAIGDPIMVEDGLAALGEISLRRLVESGLLVRVGDRVVSPFRLSLVEDVLVFGDELALGGDAVMGVGPTTAALCQASYPSRRVGRILDLGCGAGSVALCLAPRADTVVATDVNPRALVLASLNAALNGIAPAELRQGDLFVPVDGETFDLVVAQPPFVPLVDADDAAMYLHGGPRGDELVLRMLAELPAHLSRHGRAVLLVQWPLVDDDALEHRVRAAVAADDVSVLVLRYPKTDVDDYCALYAAAGCNGRGAAFEPAAERMRAHLHDRGIHAMQTAITVIQRAESGPAWTAGIDVPAAGVTSVTSSRIDKLVGSRTVLASDEVTLLAAKLGVPAGAVLRTERELASKNAAGLQLTFPDSTLCFTTGVNDETLLLLCACDQAPDVDTAVREVTTRTGASPATTLAAIRAALLCGVLEVIDGRKQDAETHLDLTRGFAA